MTGWHLAIASTFLSLCMVHRSLAIAVPLRPCQDEFLVVMEADDVTVVQYALCWENNRPINRGFSPLCNLQSNELSPMVWGRKEDRSLLEWVCQSKEQDMKKYLKATPNGHDWELAAKVAVKIAQGEDPVRLIARALAKAQTYGAVCALEAQHLSTDHLYDEVARDQI